MARRLGPWLLGALVLALCMRTDGRPAAASLVGLAPAAALESPAGRQLAWVLDVLDARGGATTPSEIAAHMHPRFLATIPADTVAASFRALAGKHAPLTSLRLQAREGGRWDLLADGASGPIRVMLDVDAATGQIFGLLVHPYAEQDADPLLAEVATLGVRAHLLVAELEAGACVPLLEVTPDRAVELASVAELYVLAALVDAIVAGERSWDERPTPDGPTLRGLAEAMIGASDGAAEAALVRALGREAVEAAMRSAAHHDVAGNLPYLTGAEVARLAALPRDDVDRYAAMSVDERRAFLARVLPERAPARDAVDLDHARVGLTASAIDLCALAARLVEQAAAHPEAAPALEILARGDRVRRHFLAPARWPYVGGKLGSLGRGRFEFVRSRVDVLRRDDGRWFVVALGRGDDAWTAPERDARFDAIHWRLIDLLADADRETASRPPVDEAVLQDSFIFAAAEGGRAAEDLVAARP